MATRRQYQTHDQEYLRKVADEGFALVDKFYGRRPAKIPPPPPPPAPVALIHRLYYPQQSQAVVMVEKPVMYSYEVVQRFDGTLIPDYQKTAPITDVTLVYIPREANSKADILAKRGADLDGERVFWSVQ